MHNQGRVDAPFSHGEPAANPPWHRDATRVFVAVADVLCQGPQTLGEVSYTVLSAVSAIGSGLPGKVLRIHVDDVLPGSTHPA